MNHHSLQNEKGMLDLRPRQDVLNSLETHPEQTKKFLRELLLGRMTWVRTGSIPPGQIGVADATHKIVCEGWRSFAQYVKREDPNCRMFRLGFTADEVEGLING